MKAEFDALNKQPTKPAPSKPMSTMFTADQFQDKNFNSNYNDGNFRFFFHYGD